MASWPYDGTVRYAELLASGWRPTPLNEFIFKVETRCNLNCDYCYVYNLGDESWKTAPRFMEPVVVERAAARVREHAMAHGLSRVGVSLHGGEPLLRGARPITEFVELMRARLAPVEVEFSMQTNATLATETVAVELGRLGIKLGISIDGDEFANRHRVDLGGKSSYLRTKSGIQVLAGVDGLVQGALAVIDIESDPVGVYRAVADLGFTSVDFLLPHGTWNSLPPGKSADRGVFAAAPYADWLIRIYDHWAGAEQRMQVRIFEDLINLLIGGLASFEALGLAPASLAVIEADGAIELVDHIGIAYGGAETTGANVIDHSLDDVLAHPGIISRQIGLAALSDECLACPVREICGAGLITHRWDDVHGFKNKTVYCADLYKLIAHIRADLLRRATPRTGSLVP
ncbi:FxsB family cyclophane-forming radical SAM/SPASM peptide maturase [Kribbella sp. NPDC051718]|uniref:FxsB family cyclophane-forming radical SAM/SPASM peptide maturase n=1 Tax=Kribbella sp. NPDC051718 TaxID=3155168 RepID=UPI003420E69B